MCLSVDRLESGLHLERQVGGRLDALGDLEATPGQNLDVALADPEVAIGCDHVRGAAPDQGQVLVEDARKNLGSTGRRAFLDDVSNEESQRRILKDAAEVETGVEEIDLLLWPVTRRQQLHRVALRFTGRADLCAGFHELAKSSRHLRGAEVGGRHAWDDARWND